MNGNIAANFTISDRIEMAISKGIPSEQIGAVLMAEAGLVTTPGVVIDQKSIDSMLGSFRN